MISTIAGRILELLEEHRAPLTPTALQGFLPPRLERRYVVDALEELVALGAIHQRRALGITLYEAMPRPTGGPSYRTFDHDGYRNIACTACLCSWVIGPTEIAVRLFDRIRDHACADVEETR